MSINLLQKWEENHKKEILKELEQASIELTIQNIPKIINETSFETRSEKYPKKCPYYQKNPLKSCHPEVEDLNCFLCACPNYTSKSEQGGCRINSKQGKWTYHPNLPKGRVWDCSDCNKYHSPKAIEDFLKDNINNLR